jgi:Tfp pilus assembly protein PilO
MQDQAIKVITLVLILILGIVSYRVFIVPKTQGIQSLHNTLKRIDTQINAIFGEDVILKGGAEQQATILKRMEELSRQIPSERDLPRILDEVVTQSAQGLNIEYQLIEPQALESKGEYIKFPLKVIFTGDYYDFIAYLSQLSQISAITNVSSLNLQRNAEDPRLINCELLINIFVMPDEAAEAPARKVEIATPSFSVDPFTARKEERGIKEILKAAAAPAPSAPSQPRLQGIWKGKEIRAFVSGKIVKLGDQIEDYTVSQIKDTEVVLTKAGKSITLKMTK